ncbi:MAG: UDP-N-acetylglucosamine 1-carboxyvinyltransferase, partial [Clostridia bacterium]|nr:UDP-N-acetylglucosamine 1-carboxyvinyltransferase [Clostridia bacterium]
MSSFIINGRNKLYGKIRVQSAKNALLPLICSCVLIDGEVIFEDCPKIDDVISLLEILVLIGGKYKFINDDLIVDFSNINSYEINCELSKKIRASIFLAGPLISKFHKVSLVYPGGCEIGLRPIDMHLSGFKSLGIKVVEENGIYLSCDKIVGNKITLRCKSVGTTINLILASIFCEGETVLVNAAKEPEIVCLCRFLKCFGAKIYGEGTSQIRIEGVKKLSKNIKRFKPIPDRIETGTYILSVMATGGEITIENCNFKHNLILIKKIYNNACKIGINNDKIYIKSIGVGSSLKNIKCLPYPNFPTDLQTPLCAYATTLNGKTIV